MLPVLHWGVGLVAAPRSAEQSSACRCEQCRTQYQVPQPTKPNHQWWGNALCTNTSTLSRLTFRKSATLREYARRASKEEDVVRREQPGLRSTDVPHDSQHPLVRRALIVLLVRLLGVARAVSVLSTTRL